MKREFARALRKEKQYLTPVQRAVFIIVGPTLIAAEVVLIVGAIQSEVLVAVVSCSDAGLAGFGNAMSTAAMKSSSEYRRDA
jgi:hypothetical protein